MDNTRLGVYNSDIDTLETSLLERVFYVEENGDFTLIQDVDPSISKIRLKEFKNQLLKRTGRVSMFTTQEVVNTYHGRKKSVYEAAQVKLDSFGLQRSDAYSCSFIKVEKCNIAKAPRCIQPRKPVYNLVLGKYIKPLEHRLYKAIGKIFNHPTVMKGYDVEQIGGYMHQKWNMFSNPVAVGIDATRFDAHVGPSILDWEHSIYRSIFRSKELNKLLNWQMNNVGKGYCIDGKLSYKVKGKRFSGDMNTALGNCIIMCAIVWSFCNTNNIRCQLANNGDDCVLFIDKEDLNKLHSLPGWFLDFGFRIKIEEPVYEFSRIEFCQMRPIWTRGKYVMVRNWHTALMKDTLCLLPVANEKYMRKWIGAVGECGLSLCAGVPVLQSFYNAFVRNGIAASNVVGNDNFIGGMWYHRGSIVNGVQTVTAKSRLSFYEAWGVTPDEQIAMEHYMDSWNYHHSPIDNIHLTTIDGLSPW